VLVDFVDKNREREHDVFGADDADAGQEAVWRGRCLWQKPSPPKMPSRHSDTKRKARSPGRSGEQIASAIKRP